MSRRARTGYKLHTKRLTYTGKSGMRSFKFPLVSDRHSKSLTTFAENIQNDYRNLVGLLNLSDWAKNNDEGETHYSLADFWLDSLRMGVIFAHKESEIAKIILRLRGDESPEKSILAKLQKKDPQLYQLVDHDAFYEFCISIQKPKDNTRVQITQKLTNKLFPHFRKERNPKVEKYARQFSKWVLEKKKDERIQAFLGFDPRPKVEFDFTFFFAPTIQMQLATPPKELLATYQTYLRAPEMPYTKEKPDIQIKKILGLYNNHGAFSNYFNKAIADMRDGGGVIRHQIISNSPYWATHTEELDERIEYLVQAAKKLSKPHLEKGWHEYRSAFGGKIESWVSNTKRQEIVLREELFGEMQECPVEETKKDTRKVLKRNHLQELQAVLTDSSLDEQVQALAKQCADILRGMQKTMIDDTNLELYRRLLADLRTELNTAYQNIYSEPEDDSIGKKEHDVWEKGHRAHLKYAPLFDIVRLVPNFLGDTKRTVYAKFVSAVTELKQADSFISVCDEALTHATISTRFSNDTELKTFTLQKFETLRGMYYRLNSTRFRHIIEGIFAKRTAVQQNGSTFDIFGLFVYNAKKRAYKDKSGDYVFWKAKQARHQREILTLDIDEKNALIVLQELVDTLKPRWDNLIRSGDFGELLDACEMEKIRLSIKVALHHDTNVPIDKSLLNKELFESAHAFLSLADNPATLSGIMLGRFLQTSILAEMRGAVSKMSRAEYVERYTIQTLGSEKRFPLCVTQQGTRQWHIALEKPQVQADTGILQIQCKQGKDFGHKTAFRNMHIASQHLLDIRTSKYHLQFLDKTVGAENSWWHKQRTKLAMGEPSFIVERLVHVRWDMDTDKVSFTKNEPRLFISIPFRLTPQPAKHLLGDRTRYMGIDVGEYGLAWTIIESDSKNTHLVQIIARGFLYEPLTHKVREFVQKLKTRQSFGTFGVPSTKLERLRQNAYTSLRNQVHDIAMRYDAIPVYEREISNFETGGNRVKVIYNSVKKADIGRTHTDDAGSHEADLIWGIKAKQFGKQVSAYATSYLCTHCGKSPYNAEKNKEKRRQLLKASRPSIADFKKLPQSKPYHADKVLREDRAGKSVWGIRRGDSAIYICQYCRHVSDADIQASYWIALKGILRDCKNSKDVIVKDESDVSGDIPELQQKHKLYQQNSEFVTILNLDLR